MRRVDIKGKRRILNDFFKVEEAHLCYQRFDGQMSPLVRRLNFERGDSVAVLIFNPQCQRLILVNQFKYPTYAKGPGWITELVAGMIDQSETPDSAARRETEEETGYAVAKLEHISTFYVSPGGSSERIILFYAEIDQTDKRGQGGGIAIEDEDILTLEVSIAEAREQIRSGEIVDAKTILAILWLENRLTEQLPQSSHQTEVGRN